MQQLLVGTNPRKRKRKVKSNPRRKSHRRRRSGPRKMTAKQARYFSKGHAPVRSNPRGKRRRRRSTAITTYRVRRNPRSSGGAMGIVTDDLLPAAVGAAGALALDMGWAYVPLPSMLSTGPLAPVVRLAGAVGFGWALGKVFGKKFGNEAAVGGITVVGYDLAKGFVQTNAPSLLPANCAAACPAAPAGTGYHVGYHVGYINPAKFIPDVDDSYYREREETHAYMPY